MTEETTDTTTTESLPKVPPRKAKTAATAEAAPDAAAAPAAPATLRVRMLTSMAGIDPVTRVDYVRNPGTEYTIANPEAQRLIDRGYAELVAA